MVSVLRAPDGAPLKSKMIYASSKDAIKKKFTGESACDPLGSEVTVAVIVSSAGIKALPGDGRGEFMGLPAR